MNNRERIGAMVAELRNEKGLTTRQLAELAGIHFGNVGRIERGVYNVSVDILSKVLEPLGAELTITKKAAE